MIVEKFNNKEFEYLKWRDQNPSGFVVNAPKVRKTKREKIHYKPAVRLHVANCPSLKRGRGGSGEYTERNYYKICSFDVELLQYWCSTNMEFEDQLGIDWRKAACKRCRPV